MDDWCVKKCLRGESAKAKKKKKVLLRVVHSAKKEKSVLLCCSSYSEFQIWDVDTGELSKTRYTLLGDGGIGSVVPAGSVIYTLGKPRRGTLDPDYTDYFNSKGEHEMVQFHEGMSFFDLELELKLGWKKGPLLKEDTDFPNCVALYGKVYVFRSSAWSCFAEVFDPTRNTCQWDTLPKPHFLSANKYKVSSPLVADPSNSCLLVHFDLVTPLASSIYAYYPADARWDCLVDNFDGDWLGPLVLLDGVMYFYVRKSKLLLQAYDLDTKQWLNVVLSSDFEDYSNYVFDALHHLGDSLLCFTTYSFNLRNIDPSIIKDHTVVIAVQFKVHRPQRDEVLLTPVSSNSSALESCCRIYGQIAI